MLYFLRFKYEYEVRIRKRFTIAKSQLMFVSCIADMGRSAIALFIVSFFVIFVAFWTGVAGCWRRSPGNITATAILILLSCK